MKSGDAAPVRLTRDDAQVMELFPEVSRDGKWVYYVAWNDQQLGRIMRVASDGGRPRAVDLPAGHYRELAISPDGRTLVFRRSSGGALLSDASSMDPSVYQVAVSGGTPQLVSHDGQLPQFGARNDRVYMLQDHGTAEEGGRPPVKLVSMNLDGGHVRDVASVRFAPSIRISPDGRYVGFVENFHAYVAPLPDTGKLIDLGAKSDGLPVKRLSETGAAFLTWSDLNTLNWSVGPTLKSAGMDAVYAEGFTPVSEGVDLGLEVAADRPRGTIALTNARIVTMADDQIIEHGTIVITDNRITAIGDSLQVPDGARVIDVAGKTVIPGLIDVHAHGTYAQELIVPQRNWSAQGHLALGVTTVHDPSSQAAAVLAAAEYARAGLVTTPRTYSTAEIIYGAKSQSWAEVESLDDALAHVRRLKAQGAISIKNYNHPRRSQRQQVTEAARREKMLVVTEGAALYHQDMNMVADGNTGIEHTLPQLAIYDDVVQFWRQTDVGYTPTLGVGYGGLEGEKYWYQHTDVWKHPLLSLYVPPQILQARSVRREMAPDEDYVHRENAAIGKRLADAGVLVNSGGHGQREGLALHWEMWMFVQGGMSPLQALRTATISAATYLGMDKDIGSLEPGKVADLVVIDGDLTADITVSDRVTHIMLNGRLFDATTLDESLTGDRTQTPFYWTGRPESAIR